MMAPTSGGLRFARTAALAFGVFLIVIETWRRFHQLGDVAMWPSIFDDYLAGLALITASRIAARSTERGRTWLAAAWGATTFMMFGSFFHQLVDHAEPDPSGVPIECVLAVKGAMLAVCLSGLVATLRSNQ